MTFHKNTIINLLKGQCIVSCQALEHEPMYGSGHMAAFAMAAVEGGAVAIRANTPNDVAAIKKAVTVPVMGLYKADYDGSEVYITPTMKEAAAIADAGADMIAVDATHRSRPDGRSLAELIQDIRARYPHLMIVADISVYEEGIAAMELNADLISTTLSGYTSYSPQLPGPDFELVRRLSSVGRTPVIAEGRIWTPDECKQSLQAGAHSVVIGTAITRPQEITKRFAAAAAQARQY